MTKKYRILSPDGFDIERDTTYKTEGEIQNAINAFIDRYRQQGYYSLSNRDRLSIDEIENHITIKLL